MIFAVFDVLLAVNMCINYSFFYIYINNDNNNNDWLKHVKTELFDIAYSEREQSTCVSATCAPLIRSRHMALYKFILID